MDKIMSDDISENDKNAMLREMISHITFDRKNMTIRIAYFQRSDLSRKNCIFPALRPPSCEMIILASLGSGFLIFTGYCNFF